MLVDTHAHVNFNVYKEDTDEVIRRALDNGVQIINVGSQYSTSKRAVGIAERYDCGVYATIGLHPIHLAEGIFKVKMDEEEISFHTKEEYFESDQYRELAKSKKVVAIGEIGLDYYYRPKTKTKLEQFKEKQKAVLCQQLDLALELNLPVILHCRLAHHDLIDMLNASKIRNSQLKGVVHCFTGNWEEAKRYMDMGFYIGLNGIIFKLDLKEVIERSPMERILLETDCPYLAPPQIKGRNEPLYVKYIAKRIAEVKNISLEEVAGATSKNAKALFNLD